MSAYAVSSRGLAAHKVPQGVLATIMEMLYSNSEQGIAKLDFSDFIGMYQDRARTIPYTAVEQPLGSFTGLNGVTATAPADVNRGVVSARINRLVKTDHPEDAAWTAGAFANWVKAPVTANATTAPDGSMTAPVITTDGANGVQGSYQVFSVLPNEELIFRTKAKMISGDSYWLKIIVNTGFSGSLVDLNFADRFLRNEVGDEWVSIEIPFTVPSSGVNQIEVGVYESQAVAVSYSIIESEVVAASNAHLPYQRVNTATDYDTVGFPHYLAFNGINTAYVTPSIDFTGTDKMTVWAGVTKLSDAAVALIAEFGTSLPLGGFYVAAPNSVGPTFGFASKGTVQATSTPLGHAAPKNAVLTGIGDISGDIASIRVNGVATTANTDQGTGNYGNLPLYIGARAGTSLFFNGRLYSLIARGAATPLPQIEVVETLIRQKMRLP